MVFKISSGDCIFVFATLEYDLKIAYRTHNEKNITRPILCNSITYLFYCLSEQFVYPGFENISDYLLHIFIFTYEDSALWP